MICGPGRSKSRLAKAAGAEPSGQMRDEKLHTVVARSTFRSQNVQNTPGADHFWQLRCRKSARRCGAKHISKSKCTKHLSVGPLLAVEMWKKCTPLWREAHFEVKMFKTHHCRTTFGSWDVEKVHAVVARSTLGSQNVENTRGLDHFWKFRFRKSARRCGAKHISKSKCSKHTIVGPLLEVEMSKKCTPLWWEAHFQVKMYKTLGDVASLHYTTLHYTPLHYRTLHYTTLHYTPVHYITLHYTPVHYTTLHYTTLRSSTLRYAPLHYTTLHHITLHYTTLHYITLYYTIFHYTSLPYTTLHSITLQLQLHSTALDYTTLHYTTLHYTTLHSAKLHYTTSHYTTLHSATLHYTTLHYTTLHSATLHYTTLHYTTLYYTEWHCATDRQVDR